MLGSSSCPFVGCVSALDRRASITSVRRDDAPSACLPVSPDARTRCARRRAQLPRGCDSTSYSPAVAETTLPSCLFRSSRAPSSETDGSFGASLRDRLLKAFRDPLRELEPCEGRDISLPSSLSSALLHPRELWPVSTRTWTVGANRVLRDGDYVGEGWRETVFAAKGAILNGSLLGLRIFM